ncbi:two-component sensor histidine kinase [Spongiactinospora gelatinilytica]|uniref:histidine kinase n=1 Tax=Spongiactinospora gelatinilytica TaxID=2666298 RepID=A0A2W2FBJ7_9ACTN|nr:histidine kinase [Spongiactinospora gelatinilytica]PZG32943.1 two-component sensor histidine kinase [Spongiactinospora gelatinilytica]
MSLTTRLDSAERALSEMNLGRFFRSRLLDVAIGLTLTLLAVIPNYVSPQVTYLLRSDGVFYSGLSQPGLIVLSGLLLATAPQMVRRRFRLPALALILIGAGILAVAEILPNKAPIPIYLSGILSVYTLLGMLPRSTRWVCGLGAAAALLLISVYEHGIWSIVGVTILVVTLLTELRGSRMEIDLFRADRLDQVKERAAMAERARIAREMHDVVAHSVSMIAVRAETAPFTLAEEGDELGEATRREFADIAGNARDALAEMRRLVGVLRADIPDAAETAPQPGLAQLPELIEQHPGDVDLDVVGEECPLPQAVDVSAFRIVQESLHNARVHAPGARVSIELAYRPTLLAIRVADNGPGDAGGDKDGAEESEGAGHGLIGMRERALALSGWFTAGPGPHGGFLVQAGLPTE